MGLRMDNGEVNPPAGGAPSVGTVTEALPDTNFRILFADGSEVLAYLGGKMRMNRIKVLVGDRVEVTLDQYKKRGRITRRL